MAISFRPPDVPPPVVERVYWRVAKGARTAEARVRVVPGVGLELRVLVGSELAHSQVYRTADEFKLLGHQSETCRADFERLGWTRVELADAPDA